MMLYFRSNPYMMCMFPFFNNNAVSAIFYAVFAYNDPATAEIYTLSLHNALAIMQAGARCIDNRRRITQNVRLTSSEGFPSGQRGQTVNLLAQPSEVRILPPPPDRQIKGLVRWDCAERLRGVGNERRV